MVTWNFFDGEKARGASTTKCNAFLPSRPDLFGVVVPEVDYISPCVLAAYLPPRPWTLSKLSDLPSQLRTMTKRYGTAAWVPVWTVLRSGNIRWGRATYVKQAK
ncbi:hypothetical protein PspLS_00372 [Pyricularia sp. CBS 133598]|nr:hypothetical protein PspLS_00372 [Pyricularia sp. CBS 133598]